MQLTSQKKWPGAVCAHPENGENLCNRVATKFVTARKGKQSRYESVLINTLYRLTYVHIYCVLFAVQTNKWVIANPFFLLINNSSFLLMLS